MRWNHIFGSKEDTADAGSNSGATADPTPAIDSESHEESDAWRSALSDLEYSWSRLDLDRLWSIYRTDLNRDLKQAKDSTPSELLFSVEEQEKKREEILAFLEQNFLARMIEDLPVSWWNRLFSPKPPETLSWDYVKSRYASSGRAKDFENEHKLYVRKKEIIEQYKPSGLFDTRERSSRIFPQMRAVREKFQSFQEQQFKLFNDYIDRVSELPFDEIDEQLSQLARDYEFLGRSREWFTEYEGMIHEINSSIPDVDEGQNESIIRLLQNDFLVVMQGRFSSYWRLHELTTFCKERNLHEIGREIELFETHLADLEASGVPAHEREQLLREFIKSIESKLTRDTEKKQSNRKKAMEDLLTHDHQARLTQWASFKQKFPLALDSDDTHRFEHNFDDITAFNALRPILRQCSEWQHELRVFRSMIKAKRSMDPRRKNSDPEHRDVQTFLETITLRIEAEIATDVAYRSLEQELVKNKEFMVDLIITRKKLALEKQLRSAKSPEVINGIKQDFVKMIWEKRSPAAKGNTVTPLLPPRRKGRF